jgi:hypothetical protein
MVHFTCDMCGKDLSPANAQRYVVKIAAYPGFDPDRLSEDDLDDDHMEAVSQLLQRLEADPASDCDGPQYKGFRFDLCAECHRRYVNDPLNRDALRSLNFSKN